MDNHRTLLLADHASKGLAGMGKDVLEQPYLEHQPECQFGARPGRGTDMATHLLSSMINYAEQASMSIVILFVDLTKAFDRIIRQILHGWGDLPADQRRHHLRGLGVSPRAIDWIAEYIQERGPLLEQWGADPAASVLARTLHEGAWLSIDDLDTAVTSCTGGRQGCKLGAQTFNAVYGVALDMIAWELKRIGVVLELPGAPAAFWSPPVPGEHA